MQFVLTTHHPLFSYVLHSCWWSQAGHIKSEFSKQPNPVKLNLELNYIICLCVGFSQVHIGKTVNPQLKRISSINISKYYVWSSIDTLCLGINCVAFMYSNKYCPIIMGLQVSVIKNDSESSDGIILRSMAFILSRVISSSYCWNVVQLLRYTIFQSTFQFI